MTLEKQEIVRMIEYYVDHNDVKDRICDGVSLITCDTFISDTDTETKIYNCVVSVAYQHNTHIEIKRFIITVSVSDTVYSYIAQLD